LRLCSMVMLIAIPLSAGLAEHGRRFTMRNSPIEKRGACKPVGQELANQSTVIKYSTVIMANPWRILRSASQNRECLLKHYLDTTLIPKGIRLLL
jgi:hypothetical protein